MVTMFENAVTTNEQKALEVNAEYLDYAEDEGFDYVHIVPGDGKHRNDPDCWCEPAKFTRASGLEIFVHRKVQ